MAKKSLAGWVFRVEIVTNKPSIVTKAMKDRIAAFLSTQVDIEKFMIDELFEDIKLFRKQKRKESA